MKDLRTRMETLYRAQGDVDAEADAVLDLTETLFLENRYDLVDEFLVTVDVCRLDATSVEGILRASFRFQHALPHWEFFLKEAEKAFSDGKYPDYLLNGLEVEPSAQEEIP